MKLQKVIIFFILIYSLPMFVFAQNAMTWKNGGLQFQWIEKPLKTKETDKTLIIHSKYYEIQCEKLEKKNTVNEPSCDFLHEIEKMVTHDNINKANCQTLTYKNCTVVLLELNSPESHTIIAMSNDPSDLKKHLIWHISTPHQTEPLQETVDLLFKTLMK